MRRNARGVQIDAPRHATIACPPTGKLRDLEASMQFGVYTFVETRRDPRTGEPVDVDKSFADVMEQAELADRVGLDVFGLGEHHRPDFGVSAPAVALAAAAARTKRIRLTSAVTVVSSDDPVRVYQQSPPDPLSQLKTKKPRGRQAFLL